MQFDFCTDGEKLTWTFWVPLSWSFSSTGEHVRGIAHASLAQGRARGHSDGTPEARLALAPHVSLAGRHSPPPGRALRALDEVLAPGTEEALLDHILQLPCVA